MWSVPVVRVVGRTQGGPGSLEMVSVRAGYGGGDRVPVRTARTCLAGRPPQDQVRVRLPECPGPPLARTRLLWLAAWGLDRPPGPRAACLVSAGPVGPGLDPPLAALRWLSGVSPDGAAAGRGRRETTVTRTPEFVCGRSSAVWHLSLAFLPIGTYFFPRVFQMLEEQGVKSTSRSPSQALPGDGKINK